MGEMNETVVQQPQMNQNEVVNTSVELGETPQVSADQNVVATQNVGLMENDPFQEKAPQESVSIEVPIQADTGAAIEEPNPIVEQQIAYNVNVDDVFEGGATKEDEITKIVTDVVSNNTPAPTAPVAPMQPAAPAQEPVITLEPGPIVPEQVINNTTIQPGPIAPAPQVDIVPPSVPTPEVPTAPVQDINAVPAVAAQPAASVEQPVMTLEPGPIPQTNPFDGVQTNVEVPAAPLAPQADFQQAEAAPLIDINAPVAAPAPVEAQVPQAPVVDPMMQAQPAVALTPDVPMQQPVVAPMTAQPAVPPVPAVAAVPAAPVEQPVMTLEPGPIPQTNPFDGVQTNVEVPAAPLAPQADFQQAEAAPLIDINAPVAAPAPVEAQVPQAPVVDPMMQAQPAVAQTPEVPMQQPAVVEAPVVAEVPAQPAFTDAGTVVETPVVATPEVPAVPEVPAPTPESPAQPALSIDEQINQGASEAVPDTTNLVAPEQPGNVVPVPVSTSIASQTVNTEDNNIEEATKTVILQSSPLGKVQPVAPIAVITELIDPPELIQKQEEIKKEEEKKQEEVPVIAPVIVAEKEEEKEEQVEVEEPKVEEVPAKEDVEEKIEHHYEIEDDSMDEVLASISLKAKTNEKQKTEVKEETKAEEPTTKIEIKRKERDSSKAKVNVEKELFIDIEASEPKQSRNSKRKIVRGEEKFKSQKKVVPVEEEPLVKFCPSCGNIVSNDDVVCPQCGDPTE